MTTINIYENNNHNDYIKNEDLEKELENIKELLGLILQDHHDMKTQLGVMKGIISRLEKRNEPLVASDLNVNQKKSIETITSALQSLDEIEKDRQDNKLKKETIDKIDNTVQENGLTVFQNKILEMLPSFTKSEASQYMWDFRRKYNKADKNERKKLLSEVWTINRLMETFNVGRWDIEKNTTKGKLYKEGYISAFKIVEGNPKSMKVLYQVSEKSENKKEPIQSRRRGGKKQGKRLRDSNSHFEVLPETAKKEYSNLKLLPNGTIEHTSSNNRTIPLKYDIYDILYIKSVSGKDTFTMGDFKELYSLKDEWDRHSLFKLIYNIRNNQKLQDIISVAIQKIKEEKTFTLKGDLLQIDGNMTYIPTHQVESWFNNYVNSNKTKDEYIWNLQKRFPEINKDCIAILFYNINNKELTSLWRKKDDVEPFVENNPSKRRNLIQNGGLL